MEKSQIRDNEIWWIFRWKKNTRYYEEAENGYLTQIWEVMVKYLFWDLKGKYAESGELLKAESWKNKAVI